MARIVNEAEYAGKRNEILDAALRFIYTKGYERMTIQDILDDLQISKGAFYHYFDSKPAILEAITKRGQAEFEQRLLTVIDDPNRTALDKLQSYFSLIDEARLAYKNFVLTQLRVWYTDDNAIVRQKVEAATIERRAPLLARIIHQGIQEGAFTTSYPDQAAEIILSLVQSMGNAHAKLLLTMEQERHEQRYIQGVVTTYSAYMDAIERVLGASSNALHRIDASPVKIWLTALGLNRDNEIGDQS